MNQNINDSKSHICNSFFQNIISGIQTFYSSSHLTKNIIRRSQSQQKLTTKITHFTILFRSKSLILRTSTQLTLKAICSRNSIKNLSHFTNFPASIFLLGVRKIICIALFLDVQELHSWSTGVIGCGGRLNNFLKAACCLDLVTFFSISMFSSVALKY